MALVIKLEQRRMSIPQYNTREYGLKNSYAIDKRKRELRERYQAELIRREKWRVEEERSRMRRLLIEGVIKPKDLKDDKFLWNEYKMKRERLDGSWVGNDPRKKIKSGKGRGTRMHTKRKSNCGRSTTTMSTELSGSQESFLTMSVADSQYTSRTGVSNNTSSDMYRSPWSSASGRHAAGGGAASRISLDVTALADQVNIPAGHHPHQHTPRRPYTAPVGREGGVGGYSALTNGNHCYSDEPIGNGGGDYNGNGYGSDDDDGDTCMTGSYRGDGDTASRLSYAMSESSKRAHTARERIRQDPRLHQLKTAKSVTSLYDIADSVVEPLRQISLTQGKARSEPKHKPKKMSMANLMR